MTQHFFTSDDVPNVTAAHSWVDEDGAWWVGIQKSGAQMALAAALTLASTQAAIATQVFSFHQDDPKLTASYEDEQTTQLSPYVATYLVSEPWRFDEQTPPLTAAYEDEQTCQVNPYVAAYAVPDPWRWDEQTPALTAGYEDEQTCQVNPYVAAYTQPDAWPFDEQVPTLTAGYVDEGLWINPVQLVQAWLPPQVITDDQVIVAQPPTGTPDDNELWQNPVAPIPYYIPPQVISDDQVIVPQPVAGISDDNEIWQPLVAALVAPTIPIPPWLADQADIVPAPTPGPTVLGRAQHLMHMPILPLPFR